MNPDHARSDECFAQLLDEYEELLADALSPAEALAALRSRRTGFPGCLDNLATVLRLVERVWPAPPQYPAGEHTPGCPPRPDAQELEIKQTAPGFPVVPGYELLGELGRGGMGVVYQARQIRLGRLVALKVVRAGGQADERELRRFRDEAEAMACLQHPNIAQVYEVGDWYSDEVGVPLPYLTMELVEGVNLAQYLAGAALDSRQAAALVETLARALQYAHEHGVIHRDLKPANVLVVNGGIPSQSECGSADYRGVKIVDFGLAKRLDAASLTQSGTMLGTPAYMAPEQTDGLRPDCGPAVDVYALGTVLYESLAGRPPFQAATPLEILDCVRSQEALPPSRLNPRVSRDLDIICLKCLQKEPKKRYPSAGQLADDLRRFLSGEPIRARQAGAAERCWRWCRRRPAVAALLAVFVAAFAGVTWFWRDAVAEQQLAETHARKARENEERAREGERRAETSAAVAYQALGELTHLVTTPFPGKSEDEVHLRLRGLEKVIDHLVRLGAERDGSRAQRFMLANTCTMLGTYCRLHRQWHKGQPVLEAACRYWRALREDEPVDVNLREGLATASKELGHVLANQGRREAALGAYREAHALWGGLARECGECRQEVFELEAVTCISSLLVADGRLQDAILFLESRDVDLTRLSRRGASEGRLGHAVLHLRVNLGDLHVRVGRPEQAIQTWAHALTQAAWRLEKEPADVELESEMGRCCQRFMDLGYDPRSRAWDASDPVLVRMLESQRAHLFRAARNNAREGGLAHALARLWMNLGERHLRQGHPEQAIQAWADALVHFVRLVEKNPGSMGLQNELVHCCGRLVQLGCEPRHHAAIAPIFEGPGNPFSTLFPLCSQHASLNDLMATILDYPRRLQPTGHKDMAGLAAYQELAAKQRQRIRERPADRGAAAVLLATLTILADQARLLRLEDSGGHARAAAGLIRELTLSCESEDEWLQTVLARRALEVSVYLRHAGDLQCSLQMAEQARDIFRRLWLAQPSQLLYGVGLSDAWSEIAKTSWQFGWRDQTCITFERALDAARVAHAQAPSVRKYQQVLSDRYHRLGRFLCEDGRWLEAGMCFLERPWLTWDDARRLEDVARELAELAAEMGKRERSVAEEAARHTYLVHSARCKQRASELASGRKPGHSLPSLPAGLPDAAKQASGHK